MRKLIILLSAVVATALVISALRQNHKDTQPRYKGHPLSYWVISLYVGTLDESNQAADTLNGLDARSIPYLVKWIQYEPPDWRDKMLKGTTGFPKPFFRLALRLIENHRLLAMGSLHTFRLLNTKDQPQAANTLARLIRSHPGPKATNRMMAALALMGPEALPAVIDTLRDPEHPCRGSAIAIIRQQWESQTVRASVSNTLWEIDPQVFNELPR
jgi:hypothetical protein